MKRWVFAVVLVLAVIAGLWWFLGAVRLSS